MADLKRANLRRKWLRTTSKSRAGVKKQGIIADNLSKAGWSWELCVSGGFRRANNPDW